MATRIRKTQPKERTVTIDSSDDETQVSLWLGDKQVGGCLLTGGNRNQELRWAEEIAAAWLVGAPRHVLMPLVSFKGYGEA